MRRLVMFAAVIGLVCAASGQATNAVSWASPAALSLTAAAKRVDVVTVVRLPDGKMRVTVAWTWLDTSGAAVRTGQSVYTQAQAGDALSAKGATVKQLRDLLLAFAAE